MSLENSPSFLLNLSECEMNGAEKHFYQFKSFRLDVEERQLLDDGNAVSLTPKSFDVLAALVERSGHLVEKNELLRLVWSDSFVEEANVARIIHTLRKVLGEDGNGNKFIETVAKKGYRFVAKVDEVLEPFTENYGNDSHNFSAFAEPSSEINEFKEFPETESEIPLAIHNKNEREKTAASLVNNQKYKTRFTLISVGFLCAVFLVFSLSFNRQSALTINPNDVKSIAVLPLKPLMSENRDSIYELGIADSLILKLNSAKGLVVRQLSATRQYTDVGQDAIAAGREQQVDFVLASNYQIAAGKIRITSQLINVQSGQVEEVFKDEQPVSSIFAVQDAVAANIGQSLLKRLSREPNNLLAKHSTANEDAYSNYLIATALVDKRSRKDIERAIEYLEQAIKLDPNYALAYVRLADAHSAIASLGGDTNEHYPKAKAAIEKALAIDENLAEAYANLGEIKMNYDWDFDAAERALKKAVALDPNSSNAHRWYSLYLNTMGRFDESIAEIKIAIDLEPTSVLNQRLLGSELYLARRYDEAIAQLQRAIEMDPNFRTSYSWLMRSYRMKGDDDKAFEWFLRSPKIKADHPEEIPLWKEIYAKSGWRGIYERQFEEAKEKEKNGKDSSWELANLYTELGDKEQAIFYLEKAFSFNEHNWAWTVIKINPRNDLLRDDPRFEDLVKRVGLK